MGIDGKIKELEQLYLKQTITVLSPHCPHCHNELGLKDITIWTDDRINQFRKQIKQVILDELLKKEQPIQQCVYTPDIRKLLGEKK